MAAFTGKRARVKGSVKGRVKSAAGVFPNSGSCAHPGCTQPGEYRAPRANPGEPAHSGRARWQYLCLEHVRAFNARWNFFAGMTEAEIREAQSPFPRRERPEFAHSASADFAVHDPLGVLRWKAAAECRGQPALSAADRQALAVLGLPETATLPEVKAKFRQLARRYHPDANAGSRHLEDRFQRLTAAYAQLCGSPGFAAGTAA